MEKSHRKSNIIFHEHGDRRILNLYDKKSIVRSGKVPALSGARRSKTRRMRSPGVAVSLDPYTNIMSAGQVLLCFHLAPSIPLKPVERIFLFLIDILHIRFTYSGSAGGARLC